MSQIAPISGHLPLRSDLLPKQYQALSSLDERTAFTAESVLRNLLPGYENTENRLHDIIQDVQRSNGLVSELRDLKQDVRTAKLNEQGELDLDSQPELRAKLEAAAKQHGFLIPGNSKLTKENVRTLLENIEGRMDSYSDTSDSLRLKMKKFTGDREVYLRMIMEILNSLHTTAVEAARNIGGR